MTSLCNKLFSFKLGADGLLRFLGAVSPGTSVGSGRFSSMGMGSLCNKLFRFKLGADGLLCFLGAVSSGTSVGSGMWT